MMKARKDREAALAAAVDAGKILHREVDAWRGQYGRDPEGTAALLGRLVGSPVAVRINAAAATNGTTYSEPGYPVTPHPQPSEPVLPGPRKTAAGATLSVRAPGVMTYADGSGEVRTRQSDRGTTQVFSFDGWVDVEGFEALGLTALDSAAASQGAQSAQTRLGRLYRGEA